MASEISQSATEDDLAKNTRIVRITVQGGVVQHVECPHGVEVVVMDFDVEGCDHEQIKRNEFREEYIESHFSHEEIAHGSV